MKDRIGNPRWVTADLVDVIDGGLGLALTTPLNLGSTVVVRGKLGGNRTADYLKAGVRWCIGKSDGTFRAGLELLDSRSTVDLDCYEVMQLSPNADTETVSRVYRMLASRYHPDNTETGDHEKFIELSEAYQILSDPKKRARYDARRREAMQARREIFDRAPASNGREEERHKEGVKASHRSGVRAGNFVPSVGALSGWNAALRLA